MPPGLTAPLAEWWQRGVARVIDGAICLTISLLLGFLIEAIFVTEAGFDMDTGVQTEAGGHFLAGFLTWLIVAALFVAYEFLMLHRGGQTLGKMAIGIKVVPLVGGVLGPEGLATGVAAKRATATFGPLLLNWIPGVGWIALFAYWLLGSIWQLVDRPYQQSLLDKVAVTVVVKTK
jgi:uncharacterized RDD family membrane protein YckC